MKELYNNFYLCFDKKNKSIKSSNNIEVKKIDQDKQEFFIVYKNEKHHLATRYNKSLDIYTTNRNKIPVFLKSSKDYLEISSSPYILFTNNSINLNIVISFLAGALYDLGCIFDDIEALLPSSVYHFDFNTYLLQHKQLNLKIVRSNRDKIIEMIVDKFTPLFNKGKNIYLLLSAGYDSRLELAVTKYLADKFNNNVTILHVYTDDFSLKVVKKIADLYNYKFKIFDSKFLINNFSYINAFPYLSGIFPIGLYMYFSLIEIIRKKDDNSSIIGFGEGLFKGKYYYKSGIDWAMEKYFPDKKLLFNFANIYGYSSNEIKELFNLNEEFIKNVINISVNYNDIYQKFDIYVL